MDRCTILVSSCDKNEDLWAPFFTVFSHQWPGCPYPIVLNTESKNYRFDGLNISTFQLYKPGDNIPWGRRLMDNLLRIDTEYVFLILEDMYPLSPVDTFRFAQCIQWMDQDPSIAGFTLFPVDETLNIQDKKYPGFEKRPQKGSYRLTCQPSIWRTSRLLAFTRPHENPWVWEVWGSRRSWRYPDAFYSAIRGTPLIYESDFMVYGCVLGKWTHETPALLEQYGITLDFEKRGYVERDQTRAYILPTETFFQKWRRRFFWYWNGLRSLI